MEKWQRKTVASAQGSQPEDGTSKKIERKLRQVLVPTILRTKVQTKVTPTSESSSTQEPKLPGPAEPEGSKILKMMLFSV